MKIFYPIQLNKIVKVALFICSASSQSIAQTQPTPQPVPYQQDFSSFTGASDVVYPSGFQGWLVAVAAPSSTGRTNAPSADKLLTTSGSATNGSTGVYDFNGKIGIFDNNANDIAIALALNTSSITSPDKVKVAFDAMVIRNLYDGGTNNIINGLVLQYRIGTSGEFINVGNCVQNGINTQTSGTDGVDIKSLSFILPQECSNQPVLQLRWIFKTVSGSAGSRPSLAFDNLVVDKQEASAPGSFNGYVIKTKSVKTLDNTTYATNILEGVTRTQALDAYGGASTDYIGNAKGYFTTYKDNRDVWHLVDPAGYKFYSIGVNTIVPQSTGANPMNLIKSVYANTIGNFSDESYTSMPYCVRLNLGYTFRNTSTERKALYDNGITPVFDADFVTYCTSQVNSQITNARILDKNLLGYFSDNELPIANSCCGTKLIDLWLDVSMYGGQAKANVNANYMAAVNWMKSRHGGVLTTPTTADRNEWPGQVAERYYKVCRDAIKARDPNHLFIGSRLHQDLANRYQFEATGKYVDVLTVNNYNVWSKAQLDARYNVWEQYTGKPFMVTEFYAQAEDSGLPNATGAGFEVKTQQDRADFFEHYTMEMLKRKWNVGFQYFKLNDDPGKNNKGLINVDGEFWEPMKTSFTKIAQDIYELRRFLIFGEQTIDIPTGIDDYKKAKATFSIQVFPNPSNGDINIEVNNYKGKTARVNIYDLQGKLVHQEFVATSTYNNKHRLDVSPKLKEGIYIVEFSGNGFSTQGKLVVR